MGKKKISLQALCHSITEECKILGDRNRGVSLASPIDKAKRDSVTFCSKSTDDGLQSIRKSRAGVIISSQKLRYREDDYKDRTLILVFNPRLAFMQVMQKYFKEKIVFAIHPKAVIDKDAKIGENAIIFGNVYIYSGVVIGRNVVIHAGTVIGSEGFGHEQNEKREWEQFPQIGGVIIEDDVEVGTNSSIMRGALGDTVIGKGTKIGHLCTIGHGATIGKHCFIGTHSLIAGSCRVGDYTQVAIGAVIRNKVVIGKNAVVGMGAVVTKDVGDGEIVYGVPAKVQGKTRPGGIYK